MIKNIKSNNIKKTQIQDNSIENKEHITTTNIEPIVKPDVDTSIPLNKTPNKNTFAVIIGNEEYQNEIFVNYALNDAIIFKEYVTKTLGVPIDQVHLVKNASYGMILREIEWLKNIAKAYNGEAKLIFYYAGHGMPDNKTKGSYILPVDGDASQIITAIELDKLYQSLNKHQTKQATVIIDACFSGSSRNGMLTTGRGVTIVPKKNVINGNLVVFSAVSGEQTSHPYTEKSHGLFTYYFLKKLQETKGEVTYKELSDYVLKEVSRRSAIRGEEQTPKVNVSYEILESWKKWTFN